MDITVPLLIVGFGAITGALVFLMEDDLKRRIAKYDLQQEENDIARP